MDNTHSSINIYAGITDYNDTVTFDFNEEVRIRC